MHLEALNQCPQCRQASLSFIIGALPTAEVEDAVLLLEGHTQCLSLLSTEDCLFAFEHPSICDHLLVG